jgi:hypothetical protein
VTTNLRRRRTTGEILRDALALTAANAVVLLVAAAAIVVPVEVACFGVGLQWLTTGFRTDSTASGVFQLAVSYLIEVPLMYGVTASVLLQVEAGQRPSALVAVRAALEAFRPLLVAAAGSIVAGCFVLVRIAVALPVVLFEDPSGLRALPRSFQLTRGAFWSTFGTILAVVFAFGIPSTVIQSGFDAIARSADAQAFHLAGSVVADLVTLAPTTVAIILLYFHLASDATAPQP